MTDREYAALIYRRVFNVKDDGGDAYTPGILKVLETLRLREQTVLENRLRRGMTMKQAGEKFSLSESSARYIFKKALRKLRHPSVIRDMSMAKIAADRNMYKEELEAVSKRYLFKINSQ